MKKYKVLVNEFKHFQIGDIIQDNGLGQYTKQDAVLGDPCLLIDVIQNMPEWFKEVPEAISIDKLDSQGIKIVILQRGWCMVGRFERCGSECKLYNASVIRQWGTSNGLGEIAKNGPTENTKLDACNNDQTPVEFDYLTVVACLPCEEEKWVKHL